MKVRLFSLQKTAFWACLSLLLCASSLTVVSAALVQSSKDTVLQTALALLPSQDALMKTIQAQEKIIANLAAQKNQPQGSWSGAFLKITLGMAAFVGAVKLFDSLILSQQERINQAKERDRAQIRDQLAKLRNEEGSTKIAHNTARLTEIRTKLISQNPALKGQELSLRTQANKILHEELATQEETAEQRLEAELKNIKDVSYRNLNKATQAILGGLNAGVGLVSSAAMALWTGGLTAYARSH